MTPDPTGLGIVTTRTARVCDAWLVLRSGQTLGPIDVAYEQYGRLAPARDNVILVCHALSGGAHAAGWHEGARKPGWWDTLIGPGKPFDTNRYCVISSNVLGSCYGTTGPASIDPATGRSYGSRFPIVTVADMVEVQRHLLDRLGITSIAAVAGGSMGGMQALQWAVSHPDRVRAVIAIATTDRHSPQQIALNEVARRAVQADPAWQDGDYYGTPGPRAGLAVARMLGHVTYLSEPGMERKFGRRRRTGRAGFGLEPEFEVEHYLDHQGRSFVDRFDANSLLYITRALDYFDLAEGSPSLVEAFRRTRAALLALSFSSDWLYPPRQLERVAAAAAAAGRAVTYHEVQSDHGHDGFLVEAGTEDPLIREFLAARAPSRGSARPHAERGSQKVVREGTDPGAAGRTERRIAP